MFMICLGLFIDLLVVIECLCFGISCWFDDYVFVWYWLVNVVLFNFVLDYLFDVFKGCLFILVYLCGYLGVGLLLLFMLLFC